MCDNRPADDLAKRLGTSGDPVLDAAILKTFEDKTLETVQAALGVAVPPDSHPMDAPATCSTCGGLTCGGWLQKGGKRTYVRCADIVEISARYLGVGYSDAQRAYAELQQADLAERTPMPRALSVVTAQIATTYDGYVRRVGAAARRDTPSCASVAIKAVRLAARANPKAAAALVCCALDGKPANLDKRLGAYTLAAVDAVIAVITDLARERNLDHDIIKHVDAIKAVIEPCSMELALLARRGLAAALFTAALGMCDSRQLRPIVVAAAEDGVAWGLDEVLARVVADAPQDVKYADNTLSSACNIALNDTRMAGDVREFKGRHMYVASLIAKAAIAVRARVRAMPKTPAKVSIGTRSSHTASYAATWDRVEYGVCAKICLQYNDS